MPLKPGSSKKAFESNVREEVKSGRPMKQAVSTAYAEKRRGAKKGKKK